MNPTRPRWAGMRNPKMRRNPARPLMAVLLGTLALAGGPAAASAPDRPPNLVFILADDLGYGDAGFMGGQNAQTPHLDALAASGLTFSHAYANGAVCAPTRAAIFSGMYAARTGVYAVGGGGGRRGGGETATPASRALITPENVDHLDPEVETLAEALRGAGYATGHFGKWHLGRPSTDNGPAASGFDLTVGAAGGGGTKSYYAPWDLPGLGEAADGSYLTDRLTDHAVDFIHEHAQQPFFLYASHYAVHTPIEPDPAVLARVKARSPQLDENAAAYAAVLESFDDGVGRLLAALDDAGVANDTVVVFASDNGGHRRYADMGGLKGHKGSLDEGGVRVPCTVRWPGTVEAGRTSDTPVILLDLYPTFLELAGARPKAGQPVDGQSWVPLLRNPDAAAANALADRPLFWYLPIYSSGPSGRVTGGPTAVVRRGPWKLMADLESQDVRLFNLVDDPGEDRDRADDEPAVVARLQRDLAAWQRDTDAPVPTPNPDYDPDASEPSDTDRPRRNRGERGERGGRGERNNRSRRN